MQKPENSRGKSKEQREEEGIEKAKRRGLKIEKCKMKISNFQSLLPNPQLQRLCEKSANTPHFRRCEKIRDVARVS